MVELDIRPARKSDAAEVALLVNIATHGGIASGWAHAAEAEGTYDPAEVGRLDMLDDEGSLNWRNATIAEHDGEVVGMLLGYREPDEVGPMPPDVNPFFLPLLELERAATGHWFVSMLGVHKPWRNQGIGGQLMDVAVSRREETSARGLALITEDVNAGARRLYERLGFSVQDSRPMAVFPGSRAPGQDWLLMVKDEGG